ncbi:uncharacterized protein KRP23_13247 [Phytophthora ramorum]|uniref:uncharacterized protein n=1 Tax=Phytophthora ramorum TaxID=164328 RepID=UPI0030B69136|nr:hypothetical protein KRP23_13245 [Phytophthora ramorum]KAH7463030.1 hypothetical protein KRP23_13247 [Phytophthora ramorum]
MAGTHQRRDDPAPGRPARELIAMLAPALTMHSVQERLPRLAKTDRPAGAHMRYERESTRSYGSTATPSSTR